MTRRNGHRTAKRANHRQPRAIRRPRERAPRSPSKLFCLWSLAGPLVKSFRASGAPPFIIDEGIRYERMNPYVSGETRHYQARSL